MMNNQEDNQDSQVHKVHQDHPQLIQTQTQTLNKLLKNHGVKAVILIYLVKTYGTLYLYKHELITKEIWHVCHFIGIQVIFIIFLNVAKHSISKNSYSIGVGIFTGRLVRLVFFNGIESIYEIPFIFICTGLFIMLEDYVEGRKK